MNNQVQVVAVNTTPKSKTPTLGFLTFCAKYLPAIPNPPPQPIPPNPTPIQSQPIPPNPTPIQSPTIAIERHNSSNSSGRRSSSSTSSSSSSSELEQVFTYFDEDGDGKISASELQTCLRVVGSCNLSDEEAEEAVRSSDADGDGMLGLNDFAKLMEKASDDDKFDELREAFGIYSDDDGQYITAKSLKKMLTRLGQSTTMSSCKAMISQFDLNGDGRLNFDEFRIMMY